MMFLVCVNTNLKPQVGLYTMEHTSFFRFNFGERGREGEREGEKQCCERETSIGCLLYVPLLQTEPASLACAPTRNGTGNLVLCGTAPNQLSHTGQGRILLERIR